MSARLSRRERRLFFLYEDELRSGAGGLRRHAGGRRLRAGGRRRGGRRLAQQLEALAAFFTWLHARGVALERATPRDLAAYRRALPAWLVRRQRRGLGAGRRRGTRAIARDDRRLGAHTLARQLGAVHGFFRFLYCGGHLRHDPGALVERPRHDT